MMLSARTRAAALALASTLALAACGHSDQASDTVTAESVELPAEQALSNVDAAPVADPAATASQAPTTTEGVAAAAGQAAADVQAAAGEDAPAPKKPAQ